MIARAGALAGGLVASALAVGCADNHQLVGESLFQNLWPDLAGVFATSATGTLFVNESSTSPTDPNVIDPTATSLDFEIELNFPPSGALPRSGRASVRTCHTTGGAPPCHG